MLMKLKCPVVFFLCFALYASYTVGVATHQENIAHSAQSKGWVDTRLYFGLGSADQPKQGVNEATWRDFLDKEVTPRFPDGLSVIDVYGQWKDKKETTPECLRSKLLIIDHSNTTENSAKINAIRDAWKRQPVTHRC